MAQSFQPDYRNIVMVARNQRPPRLPLYEHGIDPRVLSQAAGIPLAPGGKDSAGRREYLASICRCWQQLTYDTVSFECGICEILPGHGAILGGTGPIQNRDDFNKYPFADLPRIFWETYGPQLDALAAVMPPGMKALGGCGYGVFEISEDLVGYESLCLLQYDDPELFRDLYIRIGDLMVQLWSELLRRYGELFAVCRMGDDLGFKTATLLPPNLIVEHVVPQYRRIIRLVHDAGKPFLLHSCGCIFPVMDELIAAGIDAKHSNEDQIAPFSRWVNDYSQRIGLFGGIDVNVLCLSKPQEVFDYVVENARAYRKAARGYAVGSGNSIPHYVPVDGYVAMIEAVKKVRQDNGDF